MSLGVRRAILCCVLASSSGESSSSSAPGGVSIARARLTELCSVLRSTHGGPLWVNKKRIRSLERAAHSRLAERCAVDEEGASDATCRWILSHLRDPHATYMLPERADTLSERYHGRIGLGVHLKHSREFGRRRRRVVVSEVEARSPAARAGLRVGDEVLQIDGRPVGTHHEKMTHEKMNQMNHETTHHETTHKKANDAPDEDPVSSSPPRAHSLLSLRSTPLPSIEGREGERVALLIRRAPTMEVRDPAHPRTPTHPHAPTPILGFAKTSTTTSTNTSTKTSTPPLSLRSNSSRPDSD